MFKLAEAETVEARLTHCNSCEHNRLGICKKCGCVIKGKVRFPNQKCPIGLWNSEFDDLNLPPSDFSDQINKFLNPK